MTEPEFNEITKSVVDLDDRVNRAQELASGARTRTIQTGVHEHYADAIYTQVYQLALAEMVKCDCQKCQTKAKRSNRPLWYALCLCLFGILASALVVSDVLVSRWPWVAFESALAVAYFGAAVVKFKEWRKP